MLHENKLIGAKVSVIKADRDFGLLGRDELNKVKQSVDVRFGTAKTDKLLSIKSVGVCIKMKQDAKTKFCAARKNPLPLERKVDRNFDEVLSLRPLVLVEAAGLENFSSVTWVEKGAKVRL